MSDNIYSILSSKPHNPHFLKRYVKFIDACLKSNQKVSHKTYTEVHHICPKAEDLFPEYKDFRKFEWNKSILTGRQHYIAHQILMKAYGGSQIYAFVAMNSQLRKSSGQTERYKKLDSTFYANAKKANSEWMRENRKGKAAYVDKDGKIYYIKTDDPRVISGEFVSATKGRVHKKHTPEQSKERKIIFQEKFKDIPKYGNVYFLETKIKVDKKSQNFIEMIEQGWSSTITAEFKSCQSKRINHERYDKKSISAIERCDYSKYRILYDTEKQCFLSGDPLIWQRINKNVKKITGNKDFKSYRDPLTGINYQVLNTMKAPEWFIRNQNPNKK